jgi:xylan 1,4-beta-xylosidase
MYSSYTAAQIARTYELADRHGVNLLGSVTWAFEFEDQPWFAGFRDLATNGVDKPVLNVFRMLGKMGGDRVRVASSGAAAVDEIMKSGVRGAPEINALASRRGDAVQLMVWNYHDDDVPVTASEVRIAIEGLSPGRRTVTHYRIDGQHSNSYGAWLKMGSPQPPTAAQAVELEKAGKLTELEVPRAIDVGPDGVLTLGFALPRQGVSLIAIER